MKAIRSTWSIEPLGAAVVEFKGGASISSEDFTDSGFPVLHKGTIQLGGSLDFERAGKIHTSEEFVGAHQSAVVDDRFVVATLRNLVRTGETLGFVAPVPTGRTYLLAQGAYGLRLNPNKLNPRYLAHLSNAWVFHKEVLRRMVGTTQVHIRNGDFLGVPIPLPPLPEQRRIAEILDKADALRAQRRAAIAQFDTLTQSVFLDMFGDPDRNPKGWPKVRVGNLAKQIRGVTYGKEDATVERKPGYVPILRAGNISAGDVLLDDLVFVPAARMAQNQRLRRNDILIAASSGSLDVVGKAARVEQDIEAGFGAFCKVLRPSDGIDPDFFAAFFATQHYRRRVSELAAGVNIHNLRSEHLDDFPMPVPPDQLQRVFAASAVAVRGAKTAQRASLSDLDALLLVLQHRAFRGEL